METSLPAGSKLNHKCPLAWRREGTQFPLRRVGCLLSSIIAVLQRQPAQDGSQAELGRGHALSYCCLASRNSVRRRFVHVVILSSAVYLTLTWFTPPSGGCLVGWF